MSLSPTSGSRALAQAVVDDRGRKLAWPTPPARVVSLVPSDTYSLARLGAGARLVGRTRYCVEPSEVAPVEVMGGTKDVDVDRVIALEPDVVVANQEENSQRDIERLEAAGLRVLVSFPKTVAAGLAHLARLARMLGFERGEEPARTVVADAYHALRAAERAAESAREAQRPESSAREAQRPESSAREAQRPESSASPVPTFVPIWMDPLMTANDATFMADVLRLAGGVNVFGDRDRKYPLAADLGRAAGLRPDQIVGRDTRYPRVTMDEVVARAPALVLLPHEPHEFTEADAEVFRALAIPAAKNGHVVACDGRDLMWYGARSLEGIARIRALVDAARGS